MSVSTFGDSSVGLRLVRGEGGLGGGGVGGVQGGVVCCVFHADEMETGLDILVEVLVFRWMLNVINFCVKFLKFT